MNKKRVKYHVEQLIKEGLGFDLEDANLKGTPERISKMFCDEVFSNSFKEFYDFQTSPNDDNYDQIIMLDRIFFVSMCSHHFLPFTGRAWFLYIPNSLLVGASKPARLVNHYAKRPQLQERLSCQVVRAFDEIIKPKGSMLVMRAIHDCMRCRGVRQSGGAGMTTSMTSGCFRKDPTLELKGLELIKISLADTGVL